MNMEAACACEVRWESGPDCEFECDGHFAVCATCREPLEMMHAKVLSFCERLP